MTGNVHQRILLNPYRKIIFLALPQINRVFISGSFDGLARAVVMRKPSKKSRSILDGIPVNQSGAPGIGYQVGKFVILSLFVRNNVT